MVPLIKDPPNLHKRTISSCDCLANAVIVESVISDRKIFVERAKVVWHVE